jgi:hypothetical protein
MRPTLLRALASLIVLGLTAGCSDAPTAVSPDRVRPAASGGTPLSVYLFCDGSASYYYCTASAMGGSGSGYTFYWSPDHELSENGASSSASGSICNTGYSEVGVVVMDSNYEFAQTTYPMTC